LLEAAKRELVLRGRLYLYTWSGDRDWQRVAVYKINSRIKRPGQRITLNCQYTTKGNKLTDVAAPMTDALMQTATPIAAHVYGEIRSSTLNTSAAFSYSKTIWGFTLWLRCL